MRRLKILAIAYACNPTKGSESGVGWGWVNAIAEGHDVTVVTADYNATDIEKHLADCKTLRCNNPRFVYVRNRPWHYRPWGIWLKIEDSLAKPLMNLTYHDWQRDALKVAEQELTLNHYDLVHLITFVGWRFPGSFYRLGIPFVWGPIGGIKNTPWRLLPILGFKGALYYGARNLVNTFQLKTLQGPRHALKAANNGVVAATSEIQAELWNRFGVNSRVICEVGQPIFAFDSPTKREKRETFRICWSGLHLPGKALHLLLQAAARLPKDLNFSIEILGDGPCNQAWRSMASRLKLEDRCHWHGWLPRDRCLEVMRESHVFSITSLKDLTSTVAIEAISLGLPVISLNHCGFADLVTEECGIKIYPGSAEQIANDLSVALLTLCRDEPLRRHLAQGAVRSSHAYSWQAKMKILNDVYQSTAASYRSVEGNAEHPENRFEAKNESSEFHGGALPSAQIARDRR